MAGWCANNGWPVMLGDADRQKPIHAWLSRRPARLPPITLWSVDQGQWIRPPHAMTHVILDTPGYLYDLDLVKMINRVDAMVVPIGPSVVDIETSLRLLRELRQYPRVSSGRCKLGAVGMRWSHESREAWRQNQGRWLTPLLAVIPESSIYPEGLDQGCTVFDRPAAVSQTLIDPWRPLLEWLVGVWSGDSERLPATSSGRPSVFDAQLSLDGLGGQGTVNPVESNHAFAAGHPEDAAGRRALHHARSDASTVDPLRGLSSKKSYWWSRWF